MFVSPAAVWLDTYLAGYDHLFLSVQHFFADHAGPVLTPIMRTITFLGEKGWPFFLMAFVFMLLADKRDLGVCIFGAVCCGALITNLILKDNIARLRPFENSVEYELWWTMVGAPAEDGYSFPSGHVTACAAGMTAITLMRGKKWIIPSIIIVLLMAISRNYLMAHYPSDVTAAILIGVFSGFVSWFITQLIFRILRRHSDVPFFRFILDFDIRDIIPLPFLKRKKRSRSAKAAETAAPDEAENVKTYEKKQRGPVPAAPAPEAAAPAQATEPAPAAPVRRAPQARPRKPAQFDLEPPVRKTAKSKPAQFDFDAPAPKAASAAEAPAPSRRSRAAEPAPKAAGGRHALPEGSGSGKKSPGNYQGKH
jgi:undecaprenyl-diphosphatase